MPYKAIRKEMISTSLTIPPLPYLPWGLFYHFLMGLIPVFSMRFFIWCIHTYQDHRFFVPAQHQVYSVYLYMKQYS